MQGQGFVNQLDLIEDLWVRGYQVLHPLRDYIPFHSSDKLANAGV